MTVKLLLKPLVGYAHVFPCSYQFNGETRVLTDKQHVTKRTRQLNKGEVETEMMIHFPIRSNPREIIYEVNEENEPATGADMGVKNTIDDFFYFHPGVSVNGKRHVNSQGEPMWDLIDTRIQTNMEFSKWDKKRIVANYVAKSDLVELRDIAFFFGENPSLQSKNAIMLHLADFETGSIFIKSQEQDFINTFVNDQSNQRELKINTRKAIQLKVVETQLKDGKTAYYLSGEYCGGDFDQLMDFFKRNPKVYEGFVCDQINKKDVFDDESTLTKHEEKDVRGGGTIEDAVLKEKLGELIKELDAAGIVHGIKKTHYSLAKTVKLNEMYDRLIALKQPV